MLWKIWQKKKINNEGENRTMNNEDFANKAGRYVLWGLIAIVVIPIIWAIASNVGRCKICRQYGNDYEYGGYKICYECYKDLTSKSSSSSYSSSMPKSRCIICGASVEAGMEYFADCIMDALSDTPLGEMYK